jgi:hypothetical protein
MTQPGTVTIPLSLRRLLKTLLVSNLLMVGATIGISLGLVGVGSWAVVACVVVAALSTSLYALGALRQRPRVVITPEGFVYEKLFGREAARWEEVDGRFVVIQIGWIEAVAYNLTLEYKARAGEKLTSKFSGYDSAVGGALPCSAGELAELLNEHKQRNQATGKLVPAREKIPEPDAAPDRPRE